MLCEPLEVFECEIAKPLEVILAQHTALMLPVFLLIELGVGVGVVQLPMGCTTNDLTPEVIDVFTGGDDLQLLLFFGICRDLMTLIMENLNVIACSNVCQQVLED